MGGTHIYLCHKHTTASYLAVLDRVKHIRLNQQGIVETDTVLPFSPTSNPMIATISDVASFPTHLFLGSGGAAARAAPVAGLITCTVCDCANSRPPEYRGHKPG
jgi:hypothetical protein